MQTDNKIKHNYNSPYTGRFAPSPTGRLHFGSIVAALASYLQARKNRGRWLVRMEDVDIPRIQPGASNAILHGLEAMGLYWDGEIVFQSRRASAYKEAIKRLSDKNLVYECTCTRKEIAGMRYAGTCRNTIPTKQRPRSLRVLTNSDVLQFVDELQGPYKQDIEAEVGDFIIRRTDGFTSYHLAVVIDDAYQEVTEIVRGSDLLDSTPRQIFLQHLLELPTPNYIHLPLAVDFQGRKISKQNRADAILIDRPVPVLYNVLKFLGQEPAEELLDGDSDDLIQWGIDHWSLNKVPRCMKIKVNRGTRTKC